MKTSIRRPRSSSAGRGLELVEAPRWKPGFVLRGPEELRVRA